METGLYGIATGVVAAGTFFSIVGVLGYFRLPDVYTRLHAAGMVSIFGVVLLLVAAAVRTSVSWGHALVLIFFLLAAGPPVGHAIGSAAYRIGLPRKNAIRDDLASNPKSPPSEPGLETGH